MIRRLVTLTVAGLVFAAVVAGALALTVPRHLAAPAAAAATPAEVAASRAALIDSLRIAVEDGERMAARIIDLLESTNDQAVLHGH